MTTAARTAKNILHVLLSPPADPTNSSHLTTLANGILSAYNASGLSGELSSAWKLNTVTARDASGTTAQSVSSGAAVPGGVPGQCLPPNVAVCLSWQAGLTYRGGKPRTYLPGIPITAQGFNGDSSISSTYANSLYALASSFLAAVNAIAVGGGTVNLGVVSYFIHHAVRPVPDFFPYHAVEVHERLDSQRRRSGKESAFPETP